MHLVRFMIKGAPLVFVAAMSIYEHISAEGVFGILYAGGQLCPLYLERKLVYRVELQDLCPRTTAFWSRRPNRLLTRNKARCGHDALGTGDILLEWRRSVAIVSRKS